MSKHWDSTEFKRRLARLPAVMRREASAALAQNAEEWVSTARRMAPDDPETHGNDLRSSIRSYPTDTGGQVVRAGGETTTRTSAAGPFDYATAMEFGTVNHPSRPFFWPSYRLLKKRFRSRQARALSKAAKDFNDG